MSWSKEFTTDKMKEVISFLANALMHSIVDVVILAFVLAVQAIAALLILRGLAAETVGWIHRAIIACAILSVILLILGFLMGFARVASHFPLELAAWIRGGIIVWAMFSVMLAGAWLAQFGLSKLVKPTNAARRGFLKASAAAIFAVPAAAVGYGVFIQRRDIRMREQAIPITNLAADLDGLRLVQLTDIHLSPFLSEAELAHAVAMANETKAHIALVTGDMISGARDPLDTCLNRLSELRAEAGIFGCLGNHEIYAKAEDYAAEQGERLGIHYLRSASAKLKFGAAKLNLAGVDYQRFNKPYLVRAGQMIEPDVLNVLLSHNPDVFPVAARQGYQLTIAGHTHGGQVRVEILGEDLNIARFFTHYVDGLYRDNGSSIFVSRGIGTIGMPVRLGAPPEVALLRLCRT